VHLPSLFLDLFHDGTDSPADLFGRLVDESRENGQLHDFVFGVGLRRTHIFSHGTPAFG
jgi:hypothetical protein